MAFIIRLWCAAASVVLCPFAPSISRMITASIHSWWMPGACATAWLLCAWSPNVASDVYDGGLTSVEEVAQQVLARQRKLHSLAFDMYLLTNAEGTPRTDRIFTAVSGTAGYIDFMHHTGPKQDPWLDPDRFQLWFNDTGGFALKPFQRILGPADDEYSRLYWDSAYLRAIGWQPDSPVFQKQRAAGSIDALFNAAEVSKLAVTDDFEMVAEIPCVHVATASEIDAFWFAPDMDFALVKEMHVQKGQRRVTSLSRFREVVGGIWLPQHVSCRVYSIDARENAEPLSQFDIEVTNLAANEQVPTAVFAVEVPGGTMTLDSQGKPRAFKPSGNELLDQWGAWCARVIPPTMPRQVSRWAILFTGLSTALLAAGGIGAVAIRRRSSRTSLSRT